MLTANQFHKQSGLKMDFQEFLGKMKEKFGENFMDAVNAGKVKLQEVQRALGMKPEPKKAPVRKKAPVKQAEMKRADGGMKCTSCNATGKKDKNKKIVTGLAVALGAGAIIYWAMKNRK